MRPNWITCLITAGLLLAVAVYASAQDVEHGRISYVDNDGLIRGLSDEEWSVAQQNSLVMPGDSIWADEQGIMEVEVSGGTFVRLADNSRMEVVAMPPATHVRASTGSFYVHRLRHSEGDVVFETPVGSIMIENNSQVRVDVLEEGSTTVTTRWGNAIIRTADGLSVRVPSNKQVFIDPGYAPSSPVSFDRNVEDAFDTWNRERSRRIAKSSSSTKIARVGTYAAPIGTYDLEDYGEWVVVDNSSYWRPTVVDYVPYRSGRWSYVPNHGHVWVGHQPFTYVTSHHGYWKHHHRHGWIWSYHRTYSPAYVASVYHNDTFIWAPLSRHGDAVHISGSYFTAGGFHFSIGYSSYSHSRYVLSGHHHHHVYSLHHHTSYHHHKYYDAHHWNHYDTHSRHYRNRPHRIKHHSGERHYRPNHKMRGPSEVQLAGGRTYNARTRAGQLDARSSKYEFKPVLLNTNRKSHRTPTQRVERKASVRPISFNENPVQKIARRDERMRSVRPAVTPERVSTRTSGNRKSTDISTRSTKPGSIANRGGDSAKPSRPSTVPGGGSGRVTSTNKPRSTTINPSTPQTTRRPSTTSRPDGSTTRPSTPSRPKATSPRSTTTTRPQTTRPRSDASTPTRPKATSPRSTTTTRPQTTRPRSGTSTTRPQATSPPSEAPTRKTYTPRTTTQGQSRTSTTRPQATTPRKTAPSPRTYTPRTTTQSRPNTGVQRPSTPSRPQATSPRRTAPQPRVSAPRPAPRQQTSAPRRTAPQPRVSAPRPVQQQPRTSAPRQSAPQPRASAPSRSSSSSRSYSSPPSRSSSSSSRSSAPSSSSRSSGSRSSSRSR